MTDIKSCVSIAKIPIKKRKVTITWKTDFNHDFEWNLLQNLKEDPISKDEKLLCSQIQGKRQGYKHQDIVKNKYTAEKFISLSKILSLLRDSQLECRYCGQKCRLLYENVRDPQQWSLDRLDNNLGHNEDNVCISCLACNLKRRVTHYRHFVLTKQFVLCKLDGES